MKLAHLLSYLNQYASSVSQIKRLLFFFVGQNESIVRHGFNLICSQSVHLLSHVWFLATPWLQHAKLPCPTSTPRGCPNSCPLSWWCHLAISSSVVPFSSCLLSFPAWGSFPVLQRFTLGGQRFGASASSFILILHQLLLGRICSKHAWLQK